MARAATFLDRDGVINVNIGFAHRLDDLYLVDGAGQAIRRLNEAGRLVVVVTNQSGVARGFFDEAQVDAFHRHLRSQLDGFGARIDAIYTCPFHPEAAVARYRCDHFDRKPKPGMILRAVADLGIDTGDAFLIGDQDTDIAAAEAASIPGYKFCGGNLDTFLEAILAARDVSKR